MVTADLATLNYAAKFKTEMLFNRYKSARNTIQQFQKSPPYAYIVAQDQHDPMAPVELLRRMAFMGVRVKQLDRDASYGGTTYAKGTWVIPMDQEFAQLVRELFEPQRYPDMGDDTPYDAAGWTLPYLSLIHISEPTRQAEISYAVFCLKKKKKKNTYQISKVIAKMIIDTYKIRTIS